MLDRVNYDSLESYDHAKATQSEYVCMVVKVEFEVDKRINGRASPIDLIELR